MAELKSFIPPAVAAKPAAETPAPAPVATDSAPAAPQAEKPAKAPRVKARKFTKAPTPDEVKAHEAESQAGLDQIMSSMLEDHGMANEAGTTVDLEPAETPTETPVAEQKPTAPAQAKPTKTLANLAIKMGLPESTVNSMTDEQLTPVVEALYERNLAMAQKPVEQPKPEPVQDLSPQIDPELMFDAQWIEDNSVPDHLTRPITKMAERLVKLEKMNEELLKHLQADQGRKNFETVHSAFGKLEGQLKGMFGEALPKAGSPELERRMMVLHSLKQRPIPGNLPLHQQIQIRASELLPVPQIQAPVQDPAVVELERRKQLWKEGTVANPVNAAPAANDDVARAQQEIDRLWQQHFRNG